VANAGHIREKIIEMNNLNEKFCYCGLACSHEVRAMSAGNYHRWTSASRRL
jgi:4-hydroxybutyryl-CoA dehydratase/vinylacetyl-CoA-Delta-isomerase